MHYFERERDMKPDENYFASKLTTSKVVSLQNCIDIFFLKKQKKKIFLLCVTSHKKIVNIFHKSKYRKRCRLL